MACYKIRKIQHIPFSIQPTDPVIMELSSREDIPNALEDLGYLTDSKTMIVDATEVFYKGRKNGVYVSYHQEACLD